MFKLFIAILTLDMICCAKPIVSLHPSFPFSLSSSVGRPRRQSNEIIHFRDDDNERAPAATAQFFQLENSRPRNDFIVFPGQTFSRPTTRPSSTTVAIPGMGTTRSPCEDACQTTNQYNPTCGDDNVTYYNKARLDCAIKCGKKVSLKFMGRCTRELF